MGERAEAAQRTPEQNTLPFALPSLRTARQTSAARFAIRNADLFGSAASPTVTRPSLRDATGGFGPGAPDPRPCAASGSSGSLK
jgi:hypothetical protein